LFDPSDGAKLLLGGLVLEGPAVGTATVRLREGTTDTDPPIVEASATNGAIVTAYFAVPISVKQLRAQVTGTAPAAARIARA
jgi:hypothetical protein